MLNKQYVNQPIYSIKMTYYKELDAPRQNLTVNILILFGF